MATLSQIAQLNNLTVEQVKKSAKDAGFNAATSWDETTEFPEAIAKKLNYHYKEYISTEPALPGNDEFAGSALENIAPSAISTDVCTTAMQYAFAELTEEEAAIARAIGQLRAVRLLTIANNAESSTMGEGVTNRTQGYYDALEKAIKATSATVSGATAATALGKHQAAQQEMAAQTKAVTDKIAQLTRRIA